MYELLSAVADDHGVSMQCRLMAARHLGKAAVRGELPRNSPAKRARGHASKRPQAIRVSWRVVLDQLEDAVSKRLAEDESLSIAEALFAVAMDSRVPATLRMGALKHFSGAAFGSLVGQIREQREQEKMSRMMG